MDKKYAVYSATRNLYEEMVVSAKSFIVNSDVDKIFFLTEDDEFPLEIPDMIETLNMSGQTWFPEGGPNRNNHFSYMALVRAALCHIFPDIDKILALDVDTIAVRDVSAIWDIPLGDEFYLAASPELKFTIPTKGLMYVNVGVTLYNLKKLRDGKADEVISALNRWKYINVEQDVFSYLANSRIQYMPSEYNATMFTEPCDNPRIVHFAGVWQHEWTKSPEFERFRNMSWEEVFANRVK